MAQTAQEHLVEVLDRVDWDFRGSRTPQSSVHALHWFPGNFIPQIPSYLIQLLSREGDVVLDPFCGSGTTGIEALRLGRCAWQSDVSHAGIQVARGKIAATFNPLIRKDLHGIAHDLIWDEILRSDALGENGEGAHAELIEWFHEDTLAQLRYLWGIVESAKCEDMRYVLEMMFSDTLFACASVQGALTSTGGRRRHHWGWVADNVKPIKLVKHNAVKLFRDRLLRAADLLLMERSHLEDMVVLKREDARNLTWPDCSVDLVVTSPPYLGMIDYVLANRLTYLWMGWPLEEDRQFEIGARRLRNRRQAVDEYMASMRTVVKEISRTLRPGGFCAIVIGASRKYPAVSKMVINVFSECLQLFWGPRERIPSRRRVTTKEGSEPVELIAVLRK